MNTKYETHPQFTLHTIDYVSFHSHMHMECEIMHVVDGSISATIDGIQYTACKNQVLFILPHQIHSFESKTFNSENVMFISPLMIPQYSEFMKSNVLESPVITLDNPDICRLCTDILEHLFRRFPQKCTCSNLKSKVDSEALINSISGRSLVESYISLLLEGAKWKPKSNSAMDTAKIVLEYCINHYNEDMSINKVAMKTGVSEATVTRIFKSTVNCPFRKYINNLRLADAETKLIETDIPITSISGLCGFETMRTFNRVFLSEYGVTPSEYRKKYKKKA